MRDMPTSDLQEKIEEENRVLSQNIFLLYDTIYCKLLFSTFSFKFGFIFLKISVVLLMLLRNYQDLIATREYSEIT